MNPSLSVSTDNIYKFAGLFGLALIITAVFSFVTVYTSTLSEKVRLADAIGALETKTEKSKEEELRLLIRMKELEVRKSNESNANIVLLVVFGGGLLCSLWGFDQWKGRVQKRDDQIADLQRRKLELEVQALVNKGSGKAEAP